MLNSQRPCYSFTKCFLAGRYLTTNICVVGGGLAGVASAFFLADKTTRITILNRDPEPGMATVEVGLLHPLTPKGRLIWEGQRGWTLTTQLMQHGMSRGHPVFDADRNIYRLFQCKSKFDSFIRTTQNNPDCVEILDQQQYRRLASDFSEDVIGASLIKQSAIVNIRCYLKGLWEEIQDRAADAIWLTESVESIHELSKHYDVVVVAAGPSSEPLWEGGSASLKLTSRPGKVYFCEQIPTRAMLSSPPVPARGALHAMMFGHYVAPHPSKEGVVICGGSRAEKAILEDNATDMDTSGVDDWERMRAHVVQWYPSLRATEAVSVWQGYRVHVNRGHSKAKLPVICKHEKYGNAWLITGFGSRGLIHHALVAKHLSAAVRSGSLSCIPQALRLEER